MQWTDLSLNSNNVSYWSSNSADSSNNPYRIDHLHIHQGNTSGINDDDNSDDNKLAQDLNNNAVEDAVEAVANPLPVHVVIEANPCPDLLARLTIKYLFLICLQGFATTQQRILERCLQHLNLLASCHLTQSTKAWRAVEVQATINIEEIWQQLHLLNINDGDPEHLLPKVSGLLGLKLRCTSDTPLITVEYGAYCHDKYPTGQWASRGQEFALQDRHLHWEILCSKRKIIGDIAGPFPISDNPPGHLYAHREVTWFLQTHITLIKDWKLQKASVLNHLLNKNLRVSTP
jgi:hypothetical protein